MDFQLKNQQAADGRRVCANLVRGSSRQTRTSIGWHGSLGKHEEARRYWRARHVGPKICGLGLPVFDTALLLEELRRLYCFVDRNGHTDEAGPERVIADLRSESHSRAEIHTKVVTGDESGPYA